MPRPTGAGQPYLTPADTALDAAIEVAQAKHIEAIGVIAKAEAERVLGADVMEHARWRGIPNEFFVGRRQFAVAVSVGWGLDPMNRVGAPVDGVDYGIAQIPTVAKGDAVAFTYPVLYFRTMSVDGRRGAGVKDWTPVRSLCELGEIEARGRTA